MTRKQGSLLLDAPDELATELFKLLELELDVMEEYEKQTGWMYCDSAERKANFQRSLST